MLLLGYFEYICYFLISVAGLLSHLGYQKWLEVKHSSDATHLVMHIIDFQ